MSIIVKVRTVKFKMMNQNLFDVNVLFKKQDLNPLSPTLNLAEHALRNAK